jgi:hypothetical protein
MRTTNRAIRRHHVQRLKHKRKSYWGYPRYTRSVLDFPPVPDEQMPPRVLGQVVHTAQCCSCSGCGNPRRHSWFKAEMRTVQERRWLIQYREQLDELTEDD